MKEFNRKIELGRYVKLVVDTNGYNENGLDNDMMEALKTFKLHGKNMGMEDIEWRGWQRDLRQWSFIEGIDKEPNQNTLTKD